MIAQSRTSRRSRYGVLALVILIGVFTLVPDRWCLGQSKTEPTLEEQLLEDLEADPLDEGIHRELFGPDETPGSRPNKGDPSNKGDSPGGPENKTTTPGKRPPNDTAQDSDNPLLNVAQRMRSVETRIRQTDAGLDTQNAQKDIIAKLDELLQQAKKRCSGGQCKPSDKPKQKVASRKPPSQSKQPKPGSKSGPKPSFAPPLDPKASPPEQRPDIEQMRDLLKDVWGELPPNERQQMLELPVEEFLPKYELLIEAYFKRLAEQKEPDQ